MSIRTVDHKQEYPGLVRSLSGRALRVCVVVGCIAVWGGIAAIAIF